MTYYYFDCHYVASNSVTLQCCVRALEDFTPDEQEVLLAGGEIPCNWDAETGDPDQFLSISESQDRESW